MTLTLRVLEATDVVCIVKSEIPVGQYLGRCSRALGHTTVPDIAADRSVLCSMFVDMANLATKQSSRDFGLVARLAISTFLVPTLINSKKSLSYCKNWGR